MNFFNMLENLEVLCTKILAKGANEHLALSQLIGLQLQTSDCACPGSRSWQLLSFFEDRTREFCWLAELRLISFPGFVGWLGTGKKCFVTLKTVAMGCFVFCFFRVTKATSSCSV